MIHSIGVSIEHQCHHELIISVICPGGPEVTVREYDASREGDPLPPPDAGSAPKDYFMGYPYGGREYGVWSNVHSDDSLGHPYGVGCEYCFSEHEGCTLVNGEDAASGSYAYLGMPGTVDTVTYTFDTIPPRFYRAGESAGTQTFPTARPSDRATKSNYYSPVNDFSGFLNCPLNGVWKIKISDAWAMDVGYFWGWSLVFAETVHVEDTTHEQVPVAAVAQTCPVISVTGRTIAASNIQSSMLRVLDMMGRVVYQSDSPAESVRVVVPAAGVYLVQTDNGVVQKVLVL